MALVILFLLVAGCERVGDMTERVRGRLAGNETAEAPAADASALAAGLPEVSGSASWDGLPSLGGVWVAHPDVTKPARVRIALATGGTSVEGWLFGRERRGDGPPLQVSSQAAAALGLEAGETVELLVEPLGTAPGRRTAESRCAASQCPYADVS